MNPTLSCDNCGLDLGADDQFCRRCGSRVTSRTDSTRGVQKNAATAAVRDQSSETTEPQGGQNASGSRDAVAKASPLIQAFLAKCTNLKWAEILELARLTGRRQPLDEHTEIWAQRTAIGYADSHGLSAAKLLSEAAETTVRLQSFRLALVSAWKAAAIAPMLAKVEEPIPWHEHWRLGWPAFWDGRLLLDPTESLPELQPALSLVEKGQVAAGPAEGWALGWCGGLTKRYDRLRGNWATPGLRAAVKSLKENAELPWIDTFADNSQCKSAAAHYVGLYYSYMPEPWYPRYVAGWVGYWLETIKAVHSRVDRYPWPAFVTGPSLSAVSAVLSEGPIDRLVSGLRTKSRSVRQSIRDLAQWAGQVATADLIARQIADQAADMVFVLAGESRVAKNLADKISQPWRKIIDELGPHGDGH